MNIYTSPEAARAVERSYRELLGLWPVPAEHVRVPTSQGETFAVVCGPEGAPPLLLLHGSGSNGAMWLGDVATWSRRFRVHAVDLIGEPGLSAPSRPPLEPDVYAGWLAEVVTGLGVGRAAVAGMSLGGWMALSYATRHPERVSALALMCPGGIGRQRSLPALAALPLLALGGERGRRRALRLILGPHTPSGDGAAFMELIQRSYHYRRDRLPLFSGEELGRLTMPVLMIAGDRDGMIDSGGTRRRLGRAVPAADVRVLPGTGHLLPPQTHEIMHFLEATHA
ncbi:Pimeloyl-ACP methyl ester carboxylesterase [Nonomuraea solani]|uniref:Pimeloyl-ACP methyl ester carboxylesterase n=1 Tax=Nonomuraea solani TaxID=1144553 RepID=A0A1H6ES36_9ACTN|nr:alpha/beta hydrolase [Nonomuraea solani]SEG99816.1 Pimeloyl-ACP methyl ester carboxylesterase [Nonomuraea solani]